MSYIDLLTRIRNASMAKKESLKVPYSEMGRAVLDVLVERGYIDSYEKKGKAPKRFFDIKLKYEGKTGVINKIQFMSKPSRKVYVGYREIKPIKRGFGLLVISTPQGVMSGDRARRGKLGGQLLFKIW